jgi:PIN domain nuclease of toxin-antitoxin system
LRFLLDTHTLIWYSLSDGRLSAVALALIEDAGQEVLVSSASLWEVAIKVGIGKIALQGSYDAFLERCLGPDGFRTLSIEPAHLKQLTSLPFPGGHRDPFDRMLIAQAIVEDIPIIGADVAFDGYAVRRLW